MKNIKKSLLTLVFGASAAAVLLTSCGAKNYTIEFNTDGGVTIDNASVKEGEGYTLPVATKDGYSFEGWYTTEDLSGSPIVTIDAANGDVKVYAKWEKLYAVTFNLNGGTLANNKLELKAGADVYEALSSLTPTKAGVTFAGWYVNGQKLTNKLAMTTAGVTVEAKYSQNVTNEYYLEGLDGEFVKTTETATAIVGDTYTASKTENGFTVVTKEESVPSITVSDNASANVTKTYFERNSYAVTYVVDFPSGEESLTYMDYVLYGSEYTLYDDIYCDGAILLGWATEEDGEVVYPVDSYSMYVKNKDIEHKPTNIEITGEVTLYPVWQKAYTNMFAGKDYVYLLDGKAYLERGGLLFEGTIIENSNEFYFENLDEEIFLEGKLNADGTFSWASDVRANKAYNLFVSGKGLDQLTTIYFDRFNGCKYAVKDGETNLDSVSNGSYVVNADGTFTATFTDGDMAEKVITFKVGTVSGKAAFQVRDEELYGLGELPIFIVNETIIDVNPNYTFAFTGFGTANIGSSYTYYVTINEETNVVALINTSDTSNVELYVKLVEIGGEKGIAIYNADLDKTYKLNDDTLVLDGTFNAVYTSAADGVVEGIYTTSTSALGDKIITVIDESGLTYKFIVSEATLGETTVCTYKVLDADYYSEMYYSTGANAYYAPLIVIESATNASVYARGEDGYYLALAGTYVKNANGRYVFTAVTYAAETAETILGDLAQMASFEFGVTTFTTSSASYVVNYWYGYTTKGETPETVDFTKTYTYVGSNEITLTLINNYAILNIKGTVELCTATEGDGYISVTMGTSTYKFALDDENNTFDDYSSGSASQSQSIQMYEYVDGNVDKSSYIILTVTLVDAEKKEYKYEYKYVYLNEDEEEVVVEGKVEETEETSLTGFPVGKFTSTDGKIAFKFLQLSTTSGAYYFTKEVAGTKKTFTNSWGDTIELDGFGFACVYTIEGEETTYFYVYAVSEDGKTAELSLSGDSTIYLDVDLETLTFEERGAEAGTYIIMENQAMKNYVTLDGHGKASVFTYTDGEKVAVGEGQYYAYDEEIYIVYGDGENQTTIAGKFSTYEYNGNTYKIIVTAILDYADFYINFKDFSVLVIDGYNTATLYDKNGEVTKGDITFISSTLVYFVDSEATAATIFEINVEEGTMTPASYKLKGYYTTDFESLIFTQYGFVLENGGNRSFYYMNEYDEVTLYKYEPENENANEFGYASYEFGEFNDQIQYNGKTYYINTGYSIEFKRTENNASAYPLKSSSSEVTYAITSIYFAPTGLEFSVTGQATLTSSEGETQNLSVTVTRELLEDGTYALYATYSTYRFDLTAEYKGVAEDGTSASSFAITGMSQTISFKSYSYTYTCYIYYAYYGIDVTSQISDTIGGVAVKMVYDENGDIVSDKLISNFSEKSCALDSNGKPLVFNTEDYTISGTSEALTITASTVGSDGYTYTLHGNGGYLSQLGLYWVYVSAITREQTLTTTDGYEVTITQFTTYDEAVAQDPEKPNYVGYLYTVTIKKGDDVYKSSFDWDDLTNADVMWVAARTFDEDGKLVSTKFFKLVIKFENAETTLAQFVKSVEVTEVTGITLEDASGNGYVEIVDKYVVIVANDTNEVYELVSANALTNTYVVKFEADGKEYTMTITLDENGKAVVADPVEVVSDSTDTE